jgi:AraC-like DNA-binding protein
MWTIPSQAADQVLNETAIGHGMLLCMAPLPTAYTEWAAPAALRPAVVCLWAQTATQDRETLVLPDACTDLIWEQGRGVFLAGPDTAAAPARMVPGTAIVGVRFPPGAGGAVLGVPLSELRDQRVDLADLRPADARRADLSAELDPETAAARLLDLAGALVTGSTPDPDVAHAASLLRDPQLRVEDAAAEVGLSMRQLRRRCDAGVGYGPKTLQRILRFRRFVSWIDAGQDTDLAAVAVATGYADQAHLTRECVRMSGFTPVSLMGVRRNAS